MDLTIGQAAWVFLRSVYGEVCWQSSRQLVAGPGFDASVPPALRRMMGLNCRSSPPYDVRLELEDALIDMALSLPADSCSLPPTEDTAKQLNLLCSVGAWRISHNGQKWLHTSQLIATDHLLSGKIVRSWLKSTFEAVGEVARVLKPRSRRQFMRCQAMIDRLKHRAGQPQNERLPDDDRITDEEWRKMVSGWGAA